MGLLQFKCVNLITTPGEGGRGVALLYLGVLGMSHWTGCLFQLPALAEGFFFCASRFSQYSKRHIENFSILFKLGEILRQTAYV